MTDPYSEPRARMVQRQLKARGIADARVLAAMGEVPRGAFAPEALQGRAYEDGPLPIGAGQTVSQPFIVAAMIEAAALDPDAVVLEIGAGSGYAAAVMSRIARRVYAIERHASLAAEASDRLARLGYRNVIVRQGDGTHGWPDAAPFDAIIVSAGGPYVPQMLKDQLKIGGRLVIPVGESPGAQRLLKIARTGAETFTQEDLGAVAFVPLVGAHGWSD